MNHKPPALNIDLYKCLVGMMLLGDSKTHVGNSREIKDKFKNVEHWNTKNAIKHNLYEHNIWKVSVLYNNIYNDVSHKNLQRQGINPLSQTKLTIKKTS